MKLRAAMRRILPEVLKTLAICAAALVFASDGLCAPIIEMVPMRDGTKLVTEIYQPAAEGKYPVLLARGPYQRDMFAKDAEKRNREGYVMVVQSIRGTYGSEGGKDFVFTTDGWGELQDGYDTVEWIAAQPWCNGKIGTFGPSALGITQYMMAGSAPPHLACQVADFGSADLYNQCFFQGGAYRYELAEMWMKANKFPQSYWDDLAAHSSYDDFWRGMDLSTRYDKVRTPIVHYGGWYDIFVQSTIDSFVGLQYHGGEGARGNQRLVIGPLTHGSSAKAGKYEYPIGDFLRYPIVLGWYSYWLKGVGEKSNLSPAVTYYTMGALGEDGAPGNVWRTSDVWPVAHKDVPYHLHSGGWLRTCKPEQLDATRTYRFDPENPVPTVGGNNLTQAAGSMDQTKIEGRKDVLLFTTPVLTEPLEVTGRIKVKLWASASTKDTDFTAKLTDVYPNGRSMLVCDGIIRARYRESLSKPKMLTPGKPYEFEIDLWSTSLIFNKGHKIRLAISSSNWPRFDVNANTGGPIFGETRKVPSDITIYCDSAHPSRLILPVVEVKQAVVTK